MLHAGKPHAQFERRTEASGQARLLRPDYPETDSGKLPEQGVGKSQVAFAESSVVIALHSPEGVVETGPFMWLAEKNPVKLASGVQRYTFSGPV